MKKVPNLRFKEFSGEWEEKQLGKIVKFTNGKAHENCIDEQGEYIVVNSKFISSNGKVIKKSRENLCSLNMGDIAFVMSDVPNGRALAKCYFIEQNSKYTLNQRICALTPMSIESKFLFYILNRHKYFLKFDNGVGQTNLRKDDVLNCSLTIPSLKEQEKIAAFFSLIDKKIELQTEKVEELKNYKKGLMQKIFSQELRFKGFSGEWESKKIGSICEIIMGQSPSSACYNEDKIGLPLIQGNADIKNRKTFPRVYTSDITKTCDVGDIIMSVRAPVGAISRSLHHACIGRGVCSIKPKQNSEFIYQFLLNYENKWSRISQGSTFESINSFDITSTNIVLPLKEEQEKIASFFSLIDKKLELEMEKLEQLQEYKKGLLQQMFI